MERKYSVARQEVRLLSKEKIASDQIAFVRCKFAFDSAWDAFQTRFAQFAQGGNCVDQMLDDNGECDLPQELAGGFFYVSVYGVNADGSRATTVACSDMIHTSGFTENSFPAKELTPDLFAQIIRKINSVIASGGGGGIGFTDWIYDKNCNLHLVDEFGIDVIDPIYIPGLGQFDLDKLQLTAEDFALAKELVDRAAASAESATEAEERSHGYKESAESSALEAENSAKEAKEYAEQAGSNAELALSHVADAEGFMKASEAKATEAMENAEASQESAETSKGYAEEAKRAAAETKAYADAAEALKKVEAMTDLSERAEQAKLYAKAAEGYAVNAQKAAEASEALKAEFDNDLERTEAASAAAVEAAESIQGAIDTALSDIREAGYAASENVREESAEIIKASKEALEAAESASVLAVESAENAGQSAVSAAESEENAAKYAEAAQQVAAKNGYLFFEIEDGHLMETRSENVSEDMVFEINEEGRLILEYVNTEEN